MSRSITCRRHRMSPGMPTLWTSSSAQAPPTNDRSSLSKMSIPTPAPTRTAQNENQTRIHRRRLNHLQRRRNRLCDSRRSDSITVILKAKSRSRRPRKPHHRGKYKFLTLPDPKAQLSSTHRPVTCRHTRTWRMGHICKMGEKNCCCHSVGTGYTEFSLQIAVRFIFIQKLDSKRVLEREKLLSYATAGLLMNHMIICQEVSEV
jgi:hypothetical protein